MATRPRPTPMVLACLPATMARLRDATGLAEGTIQKHLRALRGNDLAHIGDWEKANLGKLGRHWMPVYYAGPGPDVPCTLERMARAEIEQRRQKRIRETGEYDLICAKKRADYWTKKAKRGDPLVNALFGAPSTEKKNAKHSTSTVTHVPATV